MEHSEAFRIVVGIDGSTDARAALTWALRESVFRPGTVELVHAWRPMYRAGNAISDAAITAQIHGQELLTAAVGHARVAASALSISGRLVRGRPSAVLLEAAADASMLVVGARGLGGFNGLPLGSVALHAVVHADCSVVVVRGRPTSKGDVVVAVDDSSENKAVLSTALREASMRRCRLMVLSVLYVHSSAEGVHDHGRALSMMLAETSAGVEADIKSLSADYPDVEVRSSFPIGYPAAVLADSSRSARLLVIGARGGGGFRGMRLGSIAHAVTHTAHCPVMVVRPRIQHS